jgi:hypothetical protein
MNHMTVLQGEFSSSNNKDNYNNHNKHKGAIYNVTTAATAKFI